MHIVYFLDVTFNLLDERYKPCKKPNDEVLYVNTSSNHSPQTIKQLPTSITNLLWNNPSNKQAFDTSKGEYEKALKESSYKNVSLIYEDKKDIKLKRNRSRNIWFNPPFFNPIQDGPFRGCSGIWGGAKRPLLPKICHPYPTIMKPGTFIPYLKKTQEIYNSRDTPYEFC